MQRISTSTKAVDLFGVGKHGFKDGNIGLGIVATQLDATIFNSVQEEICNVIESAAIALDVANRSQLLAAINSKLSLAGNPAGTIISFSGTVAPSGYLQCPTIATNISRTTYAALFAAIGTTWGAGDGSTTFGMPFFAVDDTVLQGGTVGSSTLGTVQPHTHTFSQRVDLVGGGGSQAATGVTTVLTPTGSNLAAGKRVMFCVKY